MKTKAAVYVEFGKPMVIDDIELPEPGPSQVEVKLFASGICHSQLHQLGRVGPGVRGQRRLRLPFALTQAALMA